MIKSTLSIGEISQMTGIGIHTLRMWERRYGSPKSFRLPSGHRRYSPREVPRLRAVAKAVEAGHRPSKVVGASLDDLEKLLALSFRYSVEMGNRLPEDKIGLNTSDESLINNWIAGVHDFSNQVLTKGFYEEWARRGPFRFITDCASPFIKQIGDCWQSGEITISQEHFASEQLTDFLGTMWRKIQEYNQGKICILACLPDETHNLGLQMCAVITALAGRRIIFLGSNTPCDEIINAIHLSKAELLVLSISSSYKKKDAEKCFNYIRFKLDIKVKIVVGGEGGVGTIPDTFRIASFQEYFNWLNYKEEGFTHQQECKPSNNRKDDEEKNP